MIREALRRLLVRYFGAPATSLSPPNGTEPHLLLTPGPFGYSPTIEYVHTPWVPTSHPPSALHTITIKPPADPAADGWTWEAWDREQRSLTLEGWSPCRFAYRGGDRAVFVFGVVRGQFGLWRKPLAICRMNADGTISQETDILTCATHLRSGQGMGVFEKIETAAMACDIAGKAFQRWGEIVGRDGPLWDEAERRVLPAWYELGIVTCTNVHCHEGDSRYAIYGMSTESVMAGKPEKLS
jgi:hypothetical protein